jgi:serine protease Do
MVSDVLPGSPADTSGLKVNDILLSIDGRDIDTVVAFQAAVFRRGKDPHMRLAVLRGTREFDLDVTAVEEQHALDRLSDLVSTDANLINRLGILGFNVDEKTRPMLGPLRVDSGVIVAAKTLSRGLDTNGLQTGDIIHTANGQLVQDVKGLRTALQDVKPDDPVALLVERNGGLQYVTFGGG